MVRMRDNVSTIGYPSINRMGVRSKYKDVVISAVTETQNNPTAFQTIVPIQPGNSGGPLFNYKWEALRLTTSSLPLLPIESMGAVSQSVNYAVINHLLLKNIIGTVPEALQSNHGIVVVPTDSNVRANSLK